MRILQIHNKYLQYGGEDAVVENEQKLLKKHGFKVELLLFDNSEINPRRLFFNKKSYRITKQTIEHFKPDIIHVHNIFYNASPSVLVAAKKHNIPVVMTLHNFRLICPSALLLRDSTVCTKCVGLKFPYYGIKYNCFQNSKIKSAVLATFLGLNNLNNTWSKYIDTFIVLTPFIRKLLLESSLGLSKDKIIVKPNSTDNLLSEQKQERDTFLYIGRLSSEKGIDFLVKVFNNLPAEKLEIIGDGELYTRLSKEASSNITFHGKKDRNYIKSMLSKSKALIFPSIWYEGLPNTIIEAFSSGTPILASNIENINEMVEPNFNGELFENKNEESLLQVIKQFNNNVNKVDYNNNARNTYVNKYSHEINFKNLSRIYSKMKRIK